ASVLRALLPSFPTRRSSDLALLGTVGPPYRLHLVTPEGQGDLVAVHDHVPCERHGEIVTQTLFRDSGGQGFSVARIQRGRVGVLDRKSTRLNSSHVKISYAV